MVDPNPMRGRRVAGTVLGQAELVAGSQVGHQAPRPLPAHPTHRHRHQPRVVRVDSNLRLIGSDTERPAFGGRAPVLGPVLDQGALVSESQVGVQAVALEDDSLRTLFASAIMTKYNHECPFVSLNSFAHLFCLSNAFGCGLGAYFLFKWVSGSECRYLLKRSCLIRLYIV